MKRVLLLGLLLGASGLGAPTVRAEEPVSPPLESGSKRTALLWPKMSLGSKGFAVRALQRLLTARGYSTPLDGVFGRGTQSVVRRFQRAHRLKNDGLVGYQTWEALAPTLKRGARGPLVRALQAQLTAQGTPVGVDGVFGVSTERAVKRFAQGNGIDIEEPRGFADTAVWCYLVGGHFDGD